MLGHLLKQGWSLLLPVVLMAGMLGLIASCGGDEVVKLSESANGTTVNVDDGNIIELSLKANPTTGFAWAITTVDENILLQTSDSTYDADSDALGSGGVETFNFGTIKSGTTTLELAYTQAGATEPGDTFKVTLNVE